MTQNDGSDTAKMEEREENKAEGFAEGIEKGIEKGQKSKAVEIAINLKSMNLPIETIIRQPVYPLKKQKNHSKLQNQ